MSGEDGELPAFDEWVRAVARNSSHPFVRDAEEHIRYGVELSHRLPARYQWRYSSVETIGELTQTAANAAEINQIYWRDLARSIEAYALMSYWRGMELLESAVRALNARELIPAGVVGRSCLELAAVFLTNANTVEATLREAVFPNNAVVVSEPLEEFVLKAIWGTRLGDPEPYLRQTNVCTVIARLARNPDCAELPGRYDCLCEFAHPNFLGNARFWSRIERVHPDGSETRVLTRHNEEGITEEIAVNTLWALAWSAACTRNAFELTQSGVGSLLERLGAS